MTPYGNRAYRGRLRAAALKPGSPARDTVNILGLEKYLRGVVPREMPSSWSAEAVACAGDRRAHVRRVRAVAPAGERTSRSATPRRARSTAGSPPRPRRRPRHSRRRRGRSWSTPPARRRSASSPRAAAAGRPRAACPTSPPRPTRTTAGTGNPNHNWTRALGDDAIEPAWPSIGELQQIGGRRARRLRRLGRARPALRLVGSQRSVTVSGDTARAVLGLRSTYFTFAVAARR